jgi:tRNA(fMet)-specific endonuclease VapC
LEVRVAFDTNRYVDLCRGAEESVTLFAEAELVVLPFVVLAELRAGFAYGSKQPENERTLRDFLREDGVKVIYADDQTTHHYAALYRQLRKQGTPMPTNDVWIAALVLQHNLVLHSRDRDFDKLSQLARI